MPPFAELEPLLAALARKLVAHEEAEASLQAAARRLSASPGSAAALRAMARCEVLERRSRLHVELARAALARERGELLDDQRRVPSAFRRRVDRQRSQVEVVGAVLERPARPMSNGTARIARANGAVPNGTAPPLPIREASSRPA